MEIHKDLNYYLNIFWIAVYFILQINYSRGCQAKPKIDIGSSRRHFEDNHDDGEIVDPEVPMENVAMATKMKMLGHSRNSEIPVNDIIDNFQGTMELMPQLRNFAVWP